jgi:quinol monooxygenase YgiN
MSPLIVARFVPKAGEEARVEAILRGMVASTRREPGCRRYDFYRASAAGGTLFCLIEQYSGEEAIEAHRATPHYKSYRASIADLLAQPIEVARLEAVDVRSSSP